MLFSKPSSNIRRFLYRWHRRIGVIAALFVCILCVTGLLLNHTEFLQLDNQFISSSLLRKAYGLPAVVDTQVVNLSDQVISHFNETLYWQQTAVDNCPGQLVGAVVLTIVDMQSILAACTQGLLWMDNEGMFLDWISTNQLSIDAISAIGLSGQGQPVIQHDNKLVTIDLDSLQAADYSPISDVAWSKLEPAPADIAKQLTQTFYQDAITWERVILDIHSGRLFAGRFGVLLMDLSAVVLLLLSISGVYMWWVRRI